MTELQKIEQELKQNFGNSMEPYTLELLSRYMELKGVGSGSSSSSTNTFTFPAGVGLDGVVHKNRLVMNDNGVAVLANLSGGGSGQKGRYRITTNSLPTYPSGAIYEFDFMGVNFNDGDEVVIPIAEQTNIINQYAFIARTNPTTVVDFQIGVDLIASLTSLLNLLQSVQIGAWEVNISGTKIVFRNNHILTGIGGSSNYALPTEYNNREGMFIRRDISLFNPQVTYIVNPGFTEVSFQDVYNSPVVINLNSINVDNYYPLSTGNGYFVDTSGNLAYYNGTTYENVSSITRNIQGELILVSLSNTSTSNIFTAWVPTFSINLGTNYTITQTIQGSDGDGLAQSYVDAVMNTNNNGTLIYLQDGNCNQRLAIHAFGMMGNFTLIGIPQGNYSDWSIPTTPLELSKVLKENFIQNPNTFFVVTGDGHTNNEAWIEIEEIALQTQGGCNPQLINWSYNYLLNDPFQSWFTRTQLQAPLLGTSPLLTKPVLGFLQDIVNGEVLVSDFNTNIGVVEDIIGNELTQPQLDAIELDIENVLSCYYTLGTDGQLKKLALLGNITDNVSASYLILGGGFFVGCHAAGRGEKLIVRRVIFVK